MDISGNSLEEFNIPSISKLFFKYVKINFVFCILLIISFIIYSKVLKQNFFKNILSFIFFSFLGYIIHIYSHLYNYEELSEKLINHKTFLTRNNYTKCIVRKIAKFLDFHQNTHHNSDINKQTKYQIYEFINNFVIQGLYAFLVIFFIRKLNYSISLIWGLFYATVHIINYNIIKPKVHEEHHDDKNTNFGIDIWDILFNTKNNSDIENFNHSIINLIIILIIFYFIHRLFMKK